MHPQQGRSIIEQRRMMSGASLVFLAAFLLSVVRPSSARDIEGIPYTVGRIAYGDRVFFYDAAYDGVYITREGPVVGRRGGSQQSGGNSFSNVLVHVYRPRSGFDGRLEAMPGLDSWLDPRGQLQSIESLRKQMEFEALLVRTLGVECARRGCGLMAGRVEPLMLRSAPLTGTLDRATLRIPLMKLELRYDAGSRRLAEECERRRPGRCEGHPWPNAMLDYLSRALTRARSALDAYSQRLDQVPMRTPRPLGFELHWKGNAERSGSGGGLDDLLVPGATANYEYFKRRSEYLLLPERGEPSPSIEDAVDPLALSPESRAALERARLEALAAVELAERAARALPRYSPEGRR